MTPTTSEREAQGFTEADVRHLWKCRRKFDCTIPDQALDAMRDYLLAALTRQEARQEAQGAVACECEAALVCAEAYQVVGCLLDDAGMFDTEHGEKILDNLSQARLVHKDVLPWWHKPATPPAPVDVRALRAFVERKRAEAASLDDRNKEEWRERSDLLSAASDKRADADEIERALLDGQPAGVDAARAFVQDLAANGLRFDMTPTHDMSSLDSAERFWHDYFRRADTAIRKRAHAALGGGGGR